MGLFSQTDKFGVSQAKVTTCFTFKISLMDPSSAPWRVLYCQPSRIEVLLKGLDGLGVEYYYPTQLIEFVNSDQTELLTREKPAIGNLLFVRSDLSMDEMKPFVVGLMGPYPDPMTHQCALVDNQELEVFRNLLQMDRAEVMLLHDSIHTFKARQKVRINAGLFAGTQGYVVRIRQDRKFVVGLGNLAVAISGIDRSMLDPVEE